MINDRVFLKLIIEPPKHYSKTRMGPGAFMMPKLFLASSERISIYKKWEVVERTTNFII